MSEATLEVNTRYRNDLEEEKARLHKEMDRLREKVTEAGSATLWLQWLVGNYYQSSTFSYAENKLLITTIWNNKYLVESTTAVTVTTPHILWVGRSVHC